MRALGKWLVSAILALSAFVLTVVVVVSGIFYFNPAWQARALDSYLEADTGWRWDLESAAIGWNRLAASRVFAMQNGQGFEIEEVDLRVRTLSFFDEESIRVEAGSLRGCFIDLSNIPDASLGFTRRDLASMPASEDARAAVKLMVILGLERLQMSDVDLELHDLHLEGSVLLPANRSVAFDVLIEAATTGRPDEAHIVIHRAIFH